MKKRQKSETTKIRWWHIAALGVMLAAGAACGDPGDGPGTSTAEYALQPVTSCDEVRDHMAESMTEEAIDRLYGNSYGWAADAQPAAEEDGNAADGAGQDDARSDEPDEYTETNVQEEGVDEPDIVKTDGTHIYTVTDGAFQILNSWPPEETEAISRFDFDSSVTPNSLFLHGDLAVVFSRQSNRRYYGPEPGGEVNDGEGDADEQELSFTGTRVSILDVSDRSEPELVRQLEIEGSFTDARMIDGEAFLVTNSGLRVGTTWGLRDEEGLEDLPERDWEETDEELEEMRETARPLLLDYFRDELDDTTADEWLPRQRIVDADGNAVDEGLVHDCTDLYLPSVPADLGVLNISSFDVDDSADLDSTGLVARGWEVYSSKTNLYVAMSSRTWLWGPWGWGDQDNESHIHKFSLLGDTEPKYMASGRVDGWILDQFSFSEHNNHLRVATTDNQWEWDPELEENVDEGGNHMIVLKRQGDELVETGSVRDLAPTERIYSVRFAGDRAYMVTFRFVDPFYTFDLSDPNNPEMLGELKIEGFSSYMHPLDDDHLLAIGLDGDEDGTMSGVHLQVFDVTDMHNPDRIHHHVISTGSWSSWSEAMNDHHAFTYQDRLGVLGVPVNIREDGEYFSGLLLFDATVDGIEEIGRVDHLDLYEEWVCQNDGEDTTEGCGQDDAMPAWWRARMRRSIMMSGDDGGEYVYSLSDVGLKVNETFDADEELARVILRN